MKRYDVWRRVPVMIRAVVLGLLVQVVAVMPCVALLNANLRLVPRVPWAALASVIWVGLVFLYATGRGWPASTAASRRHMSRFRALAPRSRWLASTAAGSLAVMVTALAVLGYMLVSFPLEAGGSFLALAEAPRFTAVVLVLTLSGITGLVEETAFRGYMQVPVEDRHGPFLGIGVAALVFTLAHQPPLAIVPLFLLGSVGWGVLARLAGSTRPGMLAHAAVDGGVLLWVLWHPDAFRNLLTRSLASTGVDTSMRIAILVAVVGAIITTVLFVRWHAVRTAHGGFRKA